MMAGRGLPTKYIPAVIAAAAGYKLCTISRSGSGNPTIRKGLSVPKFVTIGNETIPEAPTHKILGLTINNSLSWDDQIYGTGGVLTSIR